MISKLPQILHTYANSEICSDKDNYLYCKKLEV